MLVGVSACGGGDVMYAYAGEKIDRGFILDVEMSVVAEHLAEHSAPGTEEALARSEDRGYDICRGRRSVKLFEIVAPEFIFREYGHLGCGSIEKSLH